MPSPAEVYEKLRTAVAKKYGPRVAVDYLDTDDLIPAEHEDMAGRILTEERWVPVVALGDEIICEGVLKLSAVWAALARLGIE